MSVGGIYSGTVTHNRPNTHRLRYKIFMVALDVDELEVPGRGPRLFSHNKLNLLSLHDRDHGGGCEEPLRSVVEAKLREAGLGWVCGRIVLLSMPRMLNYVFNPLSLYFCYRQDDELAAIIYEVSNTLGERHFYVLPALSDDTGRV